MTFPKIYVNVKDRIDQDEQTPRNSLVPDNLREGMNERHEDGDDNNR